MDGKGLGGLAEPGVGTKEGRHGDHGHIGNTGLRKGDALFGSRACHVWRAENRGLTRGLVWGAGAAVSILDLPR